MDTIGRGFPGNAVVKNPGKRIHVRPRPLILPSPVLFFRRVAFFQQHGHCPAVPAYFPGSAKIQKLYLAVMGGPDIVRANIPVDIPLPMDGSQSLHNGAKHFQRLVHGKRPLRFHIFAQIHAIQIFHHEIGRPVCFKKIPDVDNPLVLGKAGHGPGFFQELVFIFLRSIGQLFYRHRNIQQIVPHPVSPAKPTCPDQAFHRIFPIQYIPFF